MKRLLIPLLAAVLTASAQDPGEITMSKSAPVPDATPTLLSDEALAAQTVVVFNESDLDSVGLASFYAEQRKIPKSNLVGIKCSGREEITRREYDENIAEPLRKVFVERGWWKLREKADEAGKVEETKIHFVALMRGVPLKIAATPSAYEGDVIEGSPAEIVQQNAAAVDSELAVLGLWSRRISGVLKNPYYRDIQSFQKTEMKSQLLVCRLDGPSVTDVRRMITDGIAAEKDGLRGFAYIDARGIPENDPRAAGLMEAERWLFSAAEHLRAHGMPVILDNGPVLFPEQYPMRHCALYLGWYYESFYGPFTQGNFKFVPGAIAVHLHSFTADTLRSNTRNWCGPFIAHGAAATMGNVYEPYLTLTPHLDVFEQRINEGFTFAEAGHMSVRFLSWMTTWVGDPLYRPFRFRLEGKNLPSNEWDAYSAGVAAWAKPGGNDDMLEEAAKHLKSGIIYEGLGLLHLRAGNNAVAERAFQSARSFYKNDEDKVRVAVHETSAVREQRGNAAALAFVRKQIASFDASTSVYILKVLEFSLAPQKGAANTPAQKAPVKPPKR
jgi:uncharacterized protein (TIGR03790 family)